MASFSVEIIGLIAAACTTTSYVPQAIQVIKFKKTRDISLVTYIVLAVGTFTWAFYGLMVRSLSVILANVLTLIPVLIILRMKIKHG